MNGVTDRQRLGCYEPEILGSEKGHGAGAPAFAHSFLGAAPSVTSATVAEGVFN